jgi:hypothetical protein
VTAATESNDHRGVPDKTFGDADSVSRPELRLAVSFAARARLRCSCFFISPPGFVHDYGDEPGDGNYNAATAVPEIRSESCFDDDRDLWCWSVYVYGVGADALYGVGEWCWWVESVVDGELHEQRECGFGDGECVVRCNCQLPGQQRFEELHDREGGSVDHVRSARRQVRGDAVLMVSATSGSTFAVVLQRHAGAAI